MKIIILGAGEVGKSLASILCHYNNDVIVVDQDEAILTDLSETYDVMTCVGNGSSPEVLSLINIASANLLITVTNSTTTNVLACVVGKTFNKDLTTICRVSDFHFFCENLSISYKDLGIDHLVVPQEECIEAILESIHTYNIREIVNLNDSKSAIIVAFKLNPGSVMIGVNLVDFPRPDLLQKLRVCGIWRKDKFIIPRGRESFNNYDEIYVAGRREDVYKLLDFAIEEDIEIKNILIAGANNLGVSLAKSLIKEGYNVNLIEPNKDLVEKALDELTNEATVFCGDVSSMDLLEEVGVQNADVFISSQASDENNVLTTLLAKKLGVDKVVAVINKPDYREVISSIEKIDCSFSMRIATINKIVNLIKGAGCRRGAFLHRISADVYEMTVHSESKICNTKISDKVCPENAIFCLIIRGGVIIAASGEQVFQNGDKVVMMGEKSALKKAEELFLVKKTLSL